MNVPSPKETNTKYQYNFLKGIDESKLAPKRRRELLRLLKGDNITESNLQEGTESIVDKSKKKIRNITDLKSEYILFLRKLLSERVDVKEWLSVSQQTERVSSMPNVLRDYINELTNNDEKKTEDILKVVIEEFDGSEISDRDFVGQIKALGKVIYRRLRHKEMRETKRFNRIEVENFIKEFDAIDIPANFKEFISNNLKNYKYRYIEFDVLWNSICEQQTTDNVQGLKSNIERLRLVIVDKEKEETKGDIQSLKEELVANGFLTVDDLVNRGPKFFRKKDNCGRKIIGKILRRPVPDLCSEDLVELGNKLGMKMLSKAEKLQTFNDKIIDFIFKRFGDSIKATLNLNSDEVEYQKKEVRNLIKEYGIKYIFKGLNYRLHDFINDMKTKNISYYTGYYIEGMLAWKDMDKLEVICGLRNKTKEELVIDKRNAFKSRFKDMYDLLTYGITNLKAADVGQLLNRTIYGRASRNELLELGENVLGMNLIMDVKNRLKNAKKGPIIDRQSLSQYGSTAFKAEFGETIIGAILGDTWRKSFGTKMVNDIIFNAFADKLGGRFGNYICNESEKKSLTRLHPSSQLAKSTVTKIDITISLLENLHDELKHKTTELSDCLYVGKLLEFNKINLYCSSKILGLPKLLKEAIITAGFFDIKLCDNLVAVMDDYMLLDGFKKIEDSVVRVDNNVLGLYKLFKGQAIEKMLEDMICRLNSIKTHINNL